VSCWASSACASPRADASCSRATRSACATRGRLSPVKGAFASSLAPQCCLHVLCSSIRACVCVQLRVCMCMCMCICVHYSLRECVCTRPVFSFCLSTSSVPCLSGCRCWFCVFCLLCVMCVYAVFVCEQVVPRAAWACQPCEHRGCEHDGQCPVHWQLGPGPDGECHTHQSNRSLPLLLSRTCHRIPPSRRCPPCPRSHFSWSPPSCIPLPLKTAVAAMRGGRCFPLAIVAPSLACLRPLISLVDLSSPPPSVALH
jgi:hypothetical protein